jgi:hypothetical protein
MSDQNPEGNLGQGELPLVQEVDKAKPVPVVPELTAETRMVRGSFDPDDPSVTNWNIQSS